MDFGCVEYGFDFLEVGNTGHGRVKELLYSNHEIFHVAKVLNIVCNFGQLPNKIFIEPTDQSKGTEDSTLVVICLYMYI